MEDLLKSLLMNSALLTAVISMASAQIVKVFLYIPKDRGINLKHLIEAGGMPSAHSAMVSALTMALGFTQGWDSPLFAVALIFSLVVMYDATGVRRAAGLHGFALNKILEDLQIQDDMLVKKFKEIMGHTPTEVAVGCVYGVSVALLIHLFLPL